MYSRQSNRRRAAGRSGAPRRAVGHTHSLPRRIGSRGAKRRSIRCTAPHAQTPQQPHSQHVSLADRRPAAVPDRRLRERPHARDGAQQLTAQLAAHGLQKHTAHNKQHKVHGSTPMQHTGPPLMASRPAEPVAMARGRVKPTSLTSYSKMGPGYCFLSPTRPPRAPTFIRTCFKIKEKRKRTCCA